MFKVNFPSRGHKFSNAQIEAVAKFMREPNQGLTQSIHLAEFERKFSDKFNLGKTLAISNAASGFHLLADLLHVKANEEIVCPAHTYCASAYPFLKYGAKIKWADINPVTRVADADYLLEAVTTKTRVIIAVHLYGFLIDLAKVRQFCDQRNIVLIEDCAQSIGANINI